MKRTAERTLLLIGACWNLVTALLTIFSYNTWFSNEGAKQFENTEKNMQLVGTHLMNNVSNIIFIFGLFVLLGAIFNFIIALRLKDNQIQNKLLVWIGIWGVFQLLTMDIVGFLLFLFAFVLYLAKNKAIKLSLAQAQ